MSPKFVDKEEKKKEIVKAAITVFAQRGFSNAKMEDVAKKAGIGKGTIYEYFKNKDELFFAIYEDVREQFNNTTFTGLKQQKTASGALREFVHSSLKAFDVWQEFSFIILDFWSEHRRGKAVHLRFNELYDESREDISEIIKAGIENGEFRKVDTLIAASAIIAVLDGLMIQKIFDPKMFLQKDVYRQISDIILTSLKKR